MEKENKVYEINGKKYRLVNDSPNSTWKETCSKCALFEVCNDQEACIWKADNQYFVTDEQQSDKLTEDRAYDDYQERSKVSGDRADSLAWAMIVLLTGQLVGGSHYLEFYIMAGAAIIYMLLSTLQSVWQSFAIWLIKCRIKNDDTHLNDYPNWVGFWAWVFYWLKMAVITAGALYGAYRFIPLL